VLLTIYGVLALSFMMLMYALEGRGKIFTLGFGRGADSPASTDSWRGTWPFGVVELVWAGVALRRYQRRSDTDHASIR
jgi:hypothetical protein